MNIKLPLLISVLLIVVNCSSKKQSMKDSHSIDSTIDKTILDFSKTDDLFKGYTVFEITQREVLQHVKGNIDSTKYRLVNGRPHQSLIQVIVKVSDLHIEATLASEIGTKSKIIPSRYHIKDNKLFYWWDSNFEVTQDTFDTLTSFGVINTQEKTIESNEGQKGVNYYFCSNNTEKFIKLESNEALSSYNTSPLFCY
ncbi:hypothetical protein [uncultured Winogradskyella sp.]|uniref:hypothetical protein n=1 Tax=uncultured Winogradskyella sp. TaxID=395353 RepID=UPI0030DC742E